MCYTGKCPNEQHMGDCATNSCVVEQPIHPVDALKQFIDLTPEAETELIAYCNEEIEICECCEGEIKQEKKEN